MRYVLLLFPPKSSLIKYLDIEAVQAELEMLTNYIIESDPTNVHHIFEICEEIKHIFPLANIVC